MPVNVRFDLSSSAVDQMALARRYNNRKRGSRSGASLGRSRSFRDGNDNRMLISGTERCNHRGNSSLCGNLPLANQCLMLDPITIWAEKYPTYGDLQRILGIALGGFTADGSSGAALAKYSNSAATKELKLLKSSVQNAYAEARSRVKKMEQSLNKLNKYCEALYSKKQQRVELPRNGRLDGCFRKMGSQIHQNPLELVSQRLEGMTEIGAASKGVDPLATELKAAIRENMLIETLVIGKDQDVLGDGVDCCQLVDENICELSAGEGWEKKRGKRCSISLRLFDGDTEAKRKRSNRVKAEHGLPSSNAQALRSATSKDISTPNQIMQMKGKDLKSSQSSAVATLCSPSGVPHASGTLEAWQKPSDIFQCHGVDVSNHYKCQFSLTSSPMAQLVERNKPKPLCAAVVSPVSDHDAKKKLLEGFDGEADDDHEEILAAADFAAKAYNLASPSIILKTVESSFSCARIKDMFFLYAQNGTTEELGASLKRDVKRKYFLGNPRSQINDCEEKVCILHHQHEPTNSGATGNAISQFQNLHPGKIEVPPLYQRVLAALIVEDEDTFDNEGRNIPPCGNATRLHLPWENCLENFSAYSGEEYYVHKYVKEDRLCFELLNIDLYPESMPDLTDREGEPIDRDIAKLQQELSQQASKKSRFAKIISEKIRRELEQLAMDRLVEIAKKKLMATQVSIASKNEVSKDTAVAFMRRTLARCRIFENTGKSCFSKPPYSEVLFALLVREQFSGSSRLPETANSMKKPAPLGSFHGTAGHYDTQIDDIGPHVSRKAIEEARPTLNREYNKEVLVDDNTHKVSMQAIEPMIHVDISTTGQIIFDSPIITDKTREVEEAGPILGRERNKEVLVADNSHKAFMEVASVLGKRGRSRDKSSFPKTDQQSTGNLRRKQRQTRAKRKKPRTNELLSAGNALVSKSTERLVPVNTSTIGQIIDAIPDITDKTGEVGLSSAADIPVENLLKNEDSADIPVSIDLDGLDEDNLPEDDCVGLDIPMDDLSTVFG